MKANFDAVLLDFDGTVADTGEGIFKSVDYAATRLGREIPDEEGHRKFVGPPLLESFEKILGIKGEEGKLAVKKYREFYCEQGMFLLEFYPGMLDFIDELKANSIKIAIASSKPEKYVRKILEHFDLISKIDFLACPEGDHQPETKEQLINRALAHFQTEKSRTLMVGDRYLDIEGAKLAGVKSCGVAYGYGGEEELREWGADFIAHRVDDMRKFVFRKEEKQE